MATTTEEPWKSPKTFYGLHNQGATCYLNSVLQLLFMTPEFNQRLNVNSRTDQKLKTLFENLKKGPCGTENITQHLHIENVGEQRDAAECLDLILNRVSPSASEVFRTELFYSTKCHRGHVLNEETNLFWTLPIPLRDEKNGLFSVERGFKALFKKKMFIGDNKAYCEDCEENTDAQRVCVMKTTPKILVLLLKRFAFDYSASSNIRSITVEIPDTLSIKGKRYVLYGIVDHWGSQRSGHYTAAIRSSEDKSWYEFNDTQVQQMKEELPQHRSSTAYLLAYRAEEQEEKSIKEPQAEQYSLSINPEPPSHIGTTNFDTLDRRSTLPCTRRKGVIVFLIVLGILIVLIVVLGLSFGLTQK